MSIEAAKPMEVADATEIAKFYNVPKSMMNAMFCVLGGKLYAMEPFLVMVGQRKGIQRIELSKPRETQGMWETECRIYPKIPPHVFESLKYLAQEERGSVLKYHMEPTIEWGRASKENVRMSTMHQWLPEMSIKRAVCRCLRKFSGVDFTSYLETENAELSRDQIDEANIVNMRKNDDGTFQAKLGA